MLGRFFRVSGRERRFFLEALTLQLCVGLLLKVIPFRRIPKLFRSRESGVDSQQADIVLCIKQAIERAGKVLPWRNRCLVSSLVARKMLNRRDVPSQLSLGVAKDTGGKTVAHAWLSSGNTEVTGKHGDYQELFVF